MNEEAILQDAYARLRAGDALAAETVLAALWNAGPAPPPAAVHLLGLIRRAQGRIAEAEELMVASISRAPDIAEYRSNLGNLYFSIGFFAQAADAYREALARPGAPEGVAVMLAQAMLAAGDPKGAERQARDVLARRSSADGHRALADALRAQGRHREALAVFDQALALDPRHVAARHDRAIVLDRLGRGEEARKIYETLSGEGLAAPELYLNWAYSLLEAGQPQVGAQKLAEGVRRHPRHPSLQSELAALRWASGEGADRFARDLEAAVGAFPQDGAMRVAAASLLNRAGRSQDAEALLRAAPGPSDPALLMGLASVLEDKGDGRGASEALRAAVSIRPDDTRLRAALAHALTLTGSAKEALEQAEFCLARNAHDQAALAYKTTALRQRKDNAYRGLYDFDRFVRAVDLPAPRGYRDAKAFNAALAAHLDTLHATAAHPLNQTLRGGTQTTRSLLESNDEVIAAFLDAALTAVRGFAGSLPTQPDHPFLGRRGGDLRFSGCWSVRLRAGGHHVNHIHEGGWISSAYYVRLPPPARGDDRHAGWLKLGAPRLQTPGCEVEKWIEPRVGRLVLFPSYMWHGTEPFGQDDRLTIAFDVIPS